MITLIVRGNSLSDIIKNQDEVVVDENPELISIDDIIVYKLGSSQSIKIVIGVPGSPISLENNYLFIRDRKIKLTDQQFECWKDWKENSPIILSNRFFVLGIHPESRDSKQHGFVLLEDIIGKVIGINRFKG
jgi:signal peptidase I